MRNKLFIAGALAVSGLGVAGTAVAAAESGDVVRDTFATKFAKRFNLNKDEVQAFIQQNHDARHAEIASKVRDALKTAGFTDEQITALQNKKQEQRTSHKEWHEANPEATTEERKAHRESQKSDFQTWATEQGIDLEKVRTTLRESHIGHGMHRGPRGNF